jgi:S-adenosylmethionine/arginine decarboxylase-like enzyme
MIGMGMTVHRLVITFDDCDPLRLDNPALVWRLLRDVVRESWSTRQADAIARLPEGGLSGFVQSGDTHISIRTWPLERHAELRVNTMTPFPMPEEIGIPLRDGLGAANVETLVHATPAPRTLPVRL